MDFNRLTEEIIAAAIEVHKALGPGLLESAYLICLCHELELRGLSFEHERPLRIRYKEIDLECGYKIDIRVAGVVVLELKAVEKLHPVHEAQLITYLRLGGWTIGLLIKFNVAVLKDGIRRRELGLQA